MQRIYPLKRLTPPLGPANSTRRCLTRAAWFILCVYPSPNRLLGRIYDGITHLPARLLGTFPTTRPVRTSSSSHPTRRVMSQGEGPTEASAAAPNAGNQTYFSFLPWYCCLTLALDGDYCGYWTLQTWKLLAWCLGAGSLLNRSACH